MKRPVNKIIIKALNDAQSIITDAANLLLCSRQQLKTWIDKDPELTLAYYEARERCFDAVETQLMKNIKDGKETSLIWFTKTQMRHRGYVDKIEQDTTMNINAIKIKYILPEEPKLEEHKDIVLPLHNEIIKIDIPNKNEP